MAAVRHSVRSQGLYWMWGGRPMLLASPAWVGQAGLALARLERTPLIWERGILSRVSGLRVYTHIRHAYRSASLSRCSRTALNGVVL